jgi:uncharacterized protein (DUF362 family)
MSDAVMTQKQDSRYQVAIAKNENDLAAVRAAINLIGGIGKFVKPGQTVIIKPNCVTQQYVPGTVTSRGVVAAIALLVVEAGAKAVVGENNLVCNPSAENFEASCGKHYFDALAALGLERTVPLVDLMADEMVDVAIENARVFKNTKVAKSVLQADKIIDVPVMKTHDQTQITLGIKNLKGVIPLSEKMRSHGLGVEQAIVDLAGFIKPALTVIDATTAAEGMGPMGGDPFRMNLVIAGENILAVDMVGAAIMGFDISQVKFLKYGVQAGLGPRSLNDITVEGLSIASVRRPFVTAHSVVTKQYKEMGINVIAENACSGCWAEFRHIYYSLDKDRPKLAGTTFVLGQIKEIPNVDKCIILGKCAKAVALKGRFVPGCPPDHKDIEKAAREVAGLPPAKPSQYDV